MKKPAKSARGDTVLSADAVATLHAAYMAGVEKAAAAATPADAALLQPAAVDFLLQLSRLRVKDYAPEKLMALLRSAAQSPDAAAVIAAELKAVTAQVSARECAKSDYGEAEVPATDMAIFNAAAAARTVDPAVEKVFAGADRLYVQLPATVTPLERKVAKALKALPPVRAGDAPGYIITDWSKGLATDKASGKQVFKIGRLLNKHAPELLKDYENRVTNNLLIVISRRAEDIARSSTNRGWNSCAGPRATSHIMAYGQMESSIRAGIMVAYLIHDRDPDINDPLARVTINVFVPNGKLDAKDGRVTHRLARLAGRGLGLADWAKGGRVYFPGKPHGLHNESFRATVRAFLDQTLNADAAGSFWLKEGVYRDRGLQNVERNRGRTRQLKRNWD